MITERVLLRIEYLIYNPRQPSCDDNRALDQQQKRQPCKTLRRSLYGSIISFWYLRCSEVVQIENATIADGLSPARTTFQLLMNEACEFEDDGMLVQKAGEKVGVVHEVSTSVDRSAEMVGPRWSAYHF